MFYLISTQIMKDNTKAQTVGNHEDIKSAKSAYHSTIASNLIAENLKTWSVKIIDDAGNEIKRKYDGDDGINDVYYKCHIQVTTEDEQISAINDYADKKTALSTMNSDLASDYASETLKSFACIVINKIGGDIESDSYAEPEPDPEPNEE